MINMYSEIVSTKKNLFYFWMSFTCRCPSRCFLVVFKTPLFKMIFFCLLLWQFFSLYLLLWTGSFRLCHHFLSKCSWILPSCILFRTMYMWAELLWWWLLNLHGNNTFTVLLVWRGLLWDWCRWCASNETGDCVWKWICEYTNTYVSPYRTAGMLYIFVCMLILSSSSVVGGWCTHHYLIAYWGSI